jgi:hypothetical protein
MPKSLTSPQTFSPDSGAPYSTDAVDSDGGASHANQSDFAQSDTPQSPKTLASLRRRKNADAQAAFRARRANYIANLEETGMSACAVF